MFETLTGLQRVLAGGHGVWPISQSSSVSACQVGYMRQKTHGLTNATKYINATNYSLSRVNLKKTTVCGCFLHHYNQRPTKYEQLFYIYLSRRYLLFIADSQLVTPQAARGAAVALISVSSRSFASRPIDSLPASR